MLNEESNLARGIRLIRSTGGASVSTLNKASCFVYFVCNKSCYIVLTFVDWTYRLRGS